MPKSTKIILFIILLLCLPSCSTKSNAELITIPTPDENTGVVTGFIKDTQNNHDLQIILFLSKNITYDNPELPPTISFSYQSNPRGILDTKTGKFYFSKVEPADNYVITVWYPPGNVKFIKEPNSSKPLQISVSAGNIIDLGIISLPDD